MWFIWMLQCIMLVHAITLPDNTSPSGNFTWNFRSVGRILAHCLGNQEAWQCLNSQAEQLLDEATRDKSTWIVSDYLSFEPQQTTTVIESRNGTERNFGSVGTKLIQLAQSRAMRMRLPRETINNAIDDFGLDQGRKKKDKDKHMAMMGGMIMIATLAQMFLGKVILIAGSAFIMAKVALAISLLGSLKKGSTGHTGSTTDHVIVTNTGGNGGHGGGSGHSHESGWHRSLPLQRFEEAGNGQDEAYIAYQMGEGWEPLIKRQSL